MLAWCFVVRVGWSVGLWICDLIALCIMSMFGFVDCNGLFAVDRGVVWSVVCLACRWLRFPSMVAGARWLAACGFDSGMR